MLLLSEFENKTTKYFLNETGLSFNSYQPSGKHTNKTTVAITCFFGNIGIISPFKKGTKLYWKPPFEVQWSQIQYLITTMQFFPCALISWQVIILGLCSPFNHSHSLGRNFAGCKNSNLVGISSFYSSLFFLLFFLKDILSSDQTRGILRGLPLEIQESFLSQAPETFPSLSLLCLYP